MLTAASFSMAATRAWAGRTLAWRMRMSSICRPIGRIGLSAARGFWKIIASSRPRISCSVFSLAARRSSPPKRMRPAVTRAAASRMPMMAKAVTDFPEPDSPTMPSVSPRDSEKPTRSSARTVPERVRNSTARSSISSSAMSLIGACSCAHAGIDNVAQAVAEQVEAEDGKHQSDAGKECAPPFARDDEARALGDHDAPFRGRRPYAKPDEGKAGRVEDGIAEGQRNLHHHDWQNVRQDVGEQNARFTVARQPRRLDIAGLAPDVRLGTSDSGIDRQVDDSGGVDDVGDGVAERRDNAHRQHEERKGHDGVDRTPDEAVGPAAEIAGGSAGERADGKSKDDRCAGDSEIEPGRYDDARENVAAELIGAEPVAGGRRLQRARGGARQRIVGRQRRAEDGEKQQEQEKGEGDGGNRVLAEHVAGVAECLAHAPTPTRGSISP